MSGKYQFTNYWDVWSEWSDEPSAYDGDLLTHATTLINNTQLQLNIDSAVVATHVFIKGYLADQTAAHVKIGVVEEDTGDIIIIAEDVALSVTGITAVDIGSKPNCTGVSIWALNIGSFAFFLCDCYLGYMPDAAVCTTPAADAPDIAVNASLNWTADDTLTDTYKIYLGTDNPPTNIVNGTSQAPADPNIYTPAAALDYGATYYWRIDSVNEAGTTPGTVQSFTTQTEFCRVYRGQDGNIDYENVVALMGLTDSQVSIPNQALPPNTIWTFIRRRVAPCGLESPDSPVCIVRIDSQGNMIPSLPNTPTSVTVEQLAAGKFRLCWRYSKINEEVSPVEFRIYVDSGSGFNFSSPTATKLYKFGGHGEFKWDSDAYTHGQRVKFCVRARPLAEAETQNTDYVAAFADALGPPAIDDVSAIVEQLP